MLSIIVPCYNEVENLPILVDKLNTLTNSCNYELEVILVNNGSTDNSAEILDSLLADNTVIRSIFVSENKGYGYGLIQGFDAAKGSVLACTHADMQTEPMAIIEAYNKYLALSEESSSEILIKGKRINRVFVEIVFTKLMQLYVNFKLKTNLSDIGAQPKLFSKNFWDTVAGNAPYDFGWDTYILYKISKIGRIETIDVDYSVRKFGEVKGGSGSWISRFKLCQRMLKIINSLAKDFNV